MAHDGSRQHNNGDGQHKDGWHNGSKGQQGDRWHDIGTGIMLTTTGDTLTTWGSRATGGTMTQHKDGDRRHDNNNAA